MKKQTKDLLKMWLFVFIFIICIDSLYFLIGGTLESSFVWIPICLGLIISASGVTVTLEKYIHKNKAIENRKKK